MKEKLRKRYADQHPLIIKKAVILSGLALSTVLLSCALLIVRPASGPAVLLPGLFITITTCTAILIFLIAGFYTASVTAASIGIAAAASLIFLAPSSMPYFIGIPFMILFFIFFTSRLIALASMLYGAALPVLLYRFLPGTLTQGQLIMTETVIAVFSIFCVLIFYVLNSELREKDAMLNGIHQRIFNNLHLTLETINIQMNEPASELQQRFTLLDMKNRLFAVSEVHRLLYQSHNFSNVRFDEVIRAVGRELISTGSRLPGITVRYDCEVASMDISQAIPCGLILLELVTNAYRHGSSGEGEKIITIAIKHQSRLYTMTVSDTGQGLPENFSPEDAETVGFMSINTMLKQIGGKMKYRNDNGAVFTVTFPE